MRTPVNGAALKSELGKDNLTGEAVDALLSLPEGTTISGVLGTDPQTAILHQPGKKPVELEKLRSINPTPLINRVAIRRLLLEQAGRTRAHKYTRVSGQTMIELNEAVRQWCITRIARLPSMGRTI